MTPTVVCYDSKYIWAHRAFIASEAKHDDYPDAEYSKTFIDMKGDRDARKRAKKHVKGFKTCWMEGNPAVET